MHGSSTRINGFTTKEAAAEVGVSESRIRQLTGGPDPIDHEYVLGRIVITQQGIVEAKARNKKLGRPHKAIPKEASNGR